MKINDEEIWERYPLKPYTAAELCDLYNISKKTFLKWIKPFLKVIGERQGYFYTVAQVETIFKKLGPPGKMFTEEP